MIIVTKCLLYSNFTSWGANPKVPVCGEKAQSLEPWEVKGYYWSHWLWYFVIAAGVDYSNPISALRDFWEKLKIRLTPLSLHYFPSPSTSPNGQFQLEQLREPETPASLKTTKQFPILPLRFESYSLELYFRVLIISHSDYWAQLSMRLCGLPAQSREGKGKPNAHTGLWSLPDVKVDSFFHRAQGLGGGRCAGLEFLDKHFIAHWALSPVPPRVVPVSYWLLV